jgi:hypothetical protein
MRRFRDNKFRMSVLDCPSARVLRFIFKFVVQVITWRPSPLLLWRLAVIRNQV